MINKEDMNILDSIYKNSRMAADCINHVADRCENEHLLNYLTEQQSKYEENCRYIRDEMEKVGGKPSEIPGGEKAMASMGINMKTYFDSSVNNIAKLMFNGTNMGIIDVTQTLNDSRNASQSVIRKAEELLSDEEKYAHGLRDFF